MVLFITVFNDTDDFLLYFKFHSMTAYPNSLDKSRIQIKETAEKVEQILNTENWVFYYSIKEKNPNKKVTLIFSDGINYEDASV